MILEACVESYAEALLAQQNGADRIELCDNLAVGGTTPSFGTVKLCAETLKIPMAVMIRPRGGNFVYSQPELQIMQEDISICKMLKCQAVVLGLLTENNEIDIVNTKALVSLASPMEVVFHKAFDELKDPLIGMEQLIDLGITRILTSGTKATALEGQNILRQMLSQAKDRIAILVAGRVTSDNLEEIKRLIPAKEFHGRKIISY
jgi:copper homeostasis protein